MLKFAPFPSKMFTFAHPRAHETAPKGHQFYTKATLSFWALQRLKKDTVGFNNIGALFGPWQLLQWEHRLYLKTTFFLTLQGANERHRRFQITSAPFFVLGNNSRRVPTLLKKDGVFFELCRASKKTPSVSNNKLELRRANSISPRDAPYVIYI